MLVEVQIFTLFLSKHTQRPHMLFFTFIPVVYDRLGRLSVIPLFLYGSNPTDWYYWEKIYENWYYYEIHDG